MAIRCNIVYRCTFYTQCSFYFLVDTFRLVDILHTTNDLCLLTIQCIPGSHTCQYTQKYYIHAHASNNLAIRFIKLKNSWVNDARVNAFKKATTTQHHYCDSEKKNLTQYFLLTCIELMSPGKISTPSRCAG